MYVLFFYDVRFMIIAFYHLVKTLIGFGCKWDSNPKNLQVELIGTYICVLDLLVLLLGNRPHFDIEHILVCCILMYIF